jgi:hypothetical protein
MEREETKWGGNGIGHETSIIGLKQKYHLLIDAGCGKFMAECDG